MRNRFHKTAEFQDILTSSNSRKGSKWVENSKKMVIFTIVCCHGNSLHNTHMNEKRNPICVANLHCECRELKPNKVETNSSFLIFHLSSFSGVHTVKNVGSHLKQS